MKISTHLAQHAVSELIQMGYTVNGDILTPPEKLSEFACGFFGVAASPAPVSLHQPEPISRAEWIAQAKAFYIESGDDETTARECAKYLCNEQDWAGNDVGDPRYEAQEDVQGRGRTGVVALAHAQQAVQKADVLPVGWQQKFKGGDWFQIDEKNYSRIHCPKMWEGARPIYATPQAPAPTDAERLDAKRYQWLSCSEWEMFRQDWLAKIGAFGEGPDALDKGIDAAMAAKDAK